MARLITLLVGCILFVAGILLLIGVSLPLLGHDPNGAAVCFLGTIAAAQIAGAM